MQVLQAHQKRVAELRDIYTRLRTQELKLFESRSQSWELQLRGDASREADLSELREAITQTEMEVEYLRDSLLAFGAEAEARSEPPSQAAEPAPQPAA